MSHRILSENPSFSCPLYQFLLSLSWEGGGAEGEGDALGKDLKKTPDLILDNSLGETSNPNYEETPAGGDLKETPDPSFEETPAVTADGDLKKTSDPILSNNDLPESSNDSAKSAKDDEDGITDLGRMDGGVEIPLQY